VISCELPYKIWSPKTTFPGYRTVKITSSYVENIHDGARDGQTDVAGRKGNMRYSVAAAVLSRVIKLCPDDTFRLMLAGDAYVISSQNVQPVADPGFPEGGRRRENRGEGGAVWREGIFDLIISK